MCDECIIVFCVPRLMSSVHEMDCLMGGGGYGVPKVQDHLHSFERVKLQDVKTAPESQLQGLLSVFVFNLHLKKKHI